MSDYATAADRIKENVAGRQDETSSDEEQELWAGGDSGNAKYGTWNLGG